MSKREPSERVKLARECDRLEKQIALWSEKVAANQAKLTETLERLAALSKPAETEE